MKTTTATRSRTFEWQDPMVSLEQAKTMTGYDFLQAVTAGELPGSPLMHTLDFKPAGLEKGKVVFAFTPQEFHFNPLGSVHGGVITSILDSAMGCALHSLLDAGVVYTTLELKVNFLKAANLRSGALKATGRVLHLGGRTALTEAQLTDEAGTVYAHALSTCLIIR